MTDYTVSQSPPFKRHTLWEKYKKWIYPLIFTALWTTVIASMTSQAQVKIPGSNPSTKLEAAGSLLMMVDTILFVWFVRILAGLCVLNAGWLIKELKFGPAVVSVVGGIIIGTSPMWVQNFLSIGNGGGVFN